MSLNRYQPKQAFPPYAYIPGVNTHPSETGGYRAGLSDPVVKPVDPAVALQNETLLFAVDLFNHAYFWESHVYFEALWNAHARSGSQADFLKGLIKLAAAGVRLQAGRKETSILHFNRAVELFTSVRRKEGPNSIGFNLDELIKSTEALPESIEKMFQIRLSSDET